MPAIVLVLLSIALPLAAQPNGPQRVGVGPVERSLSLEQAIEMALANNLEIEVERLSRNLSQESAAGARGFFDPTFRWTPGIESANVPTGSLLLGQNGKLVDRYFRQNFYFQQRIPERGSSFGISFENSRDSTNNPFAGLNPFVTSRLFFNFTQPLLRNRETDAQRSELEIRRKRADLSEVELELSVTEVVFRTEQAYWNLVAARSDAAVRAEFVDLAREQLARNQRFIDAGTLAPVELSASEAELERRLDSWYAAVGLVTEVENSLKMLLAGGAASDLWNDEIVPSDSIGKTQPPAIYELQESIRQAIASRPELRALDAQLTVNDVQKKQNQNALKPEMNLVAAWGLTGLGGSVNQVDNPFSQSQEVLVQRLNELSLRAGLTPVRPDFGGDALPDRVIGGYGTTLSNLFGGSFQTFQVGLSFDFTMRNQTARSNLAQSVISERQIRTRRTQAEQLVAADVRNAYQAIQTARQRIHAASASVRAAKEKLDSETRLFQNGESTNFLVLTRQNEYADSRLREVVAKLELNKALASLQRALGATLETYRVAIR